jgi:hypothetical protein
VGFQDQLCADLDHIKAPSISLAGLCTGDKARAGKRIGGPLGSYGAQGIEGTGEIRTEELAFSQGCFESLPGPWAIPGLGPVDQSLAPG